MTHLAQNHRPGHSAVRRHTTRPPVRRARRDPLVPADWQVEVLVRWLADEVRAGVYGAEGGLPETGVVARLFEIDYPLADEAVRQLAAQGHISPDRQSAASGLASLRSGGAPVAVPHGEALVREQVVAAAADALLVWRRHEARTPRALDTQQAQLRMILQTLCGDLAVETSQHPSLALARARFLAVVPGPFPSWARPWHIAWLGLAALALLESHPELLARLEPKVGWAFTAPPPECLTSGRRLTDAAEREAAGAWLVEQYRAGASIPTLAKAARRSYGLVHALLAEAGTDFRPRGFPNRRRKNADPADQNLESI
ncbi:helix-turn-helix domain-containing protein [Streptomyces sp. NPDC002992]|uniref:helix-turn-helix domain-containing protein n=1 Tax=Streptomyces sp. NPDC002992 TaxID=3154273 RepID=UPI0033B57238